MGNAVSETKDFHWEYTDSPHASRRIEMLKKYPEIKSLMKTNGDWTMVAVGLFLLFIQFLLAFINLYVVHSLPLNFLLNCTLGSWISSAIFMQMHEAGHGTIFGANHVWKNRIYGSLMNLGLGVPLYAYFKRHHKIHHKYQGEKNLDVEYPYENELDHFNGTLKKYLWMVINPEIQGFRSRNSFIDGLNFEEKLGLASIFIFDGLLLVTGNFYFLSHLVLSNVAAMSGPVLGFWNISVHVEFLEKQETSSYYGWMNYFMSNFGYHMQHHDFPNIPSRYLPQVKKIASEFYEEDYSYDSLYSCAIKFIFDSKYGVFSRVKRDSKRQSSNRLLH